MVAFDGKPRPSRLHGTLTKVLLVDVDGTLMENSGLAFGEFGSMVEGAAECLRRLHAAGWFIVIYTTRKATRDLVAWLRDGGAVWDTINSADHNRYPGSGKPECGVLFDDRAWPICGRQWTPAMWREATENLLEAS